MAQLGTYYNEATWSTDEYFSKKVTDNFFDSNPVTYMMKDRAETLNGGEALALSSIFDGADGEWFQEWGTYSNAHKEQLGAGVLDWKLYTVPVLLSNMQLLKNSNSREARYKLAKLKNMVAARTAASDFGTALFVATGSANADAIDTLDNAVAATGTYATIDRSTAPGSTVWVSTVDSTTTTMSPSAIQVNMGAASYGSERPNLLATTQAIYNTLYDLYTPIQRVGGSEMLGKQGFTSLIYNNAPVVVDHKIPANHLYGLNMNHIDLKAHREAFFSFEKYVVPSSQWVSIGRYHFMGNVCNHGPRYHFKMTALTG